MKKTQKILPISSGVEISKNITIPGSKSITNRAFLLSALSVLDSKDNEVAILNGVLESDDTKAFCECLKSLGFEIISNNHKYKIFPVSKTKILDHWKENLIEIYCHDAGTAVRFLIPMIAALGGFAVKVTASEQMTRRPIQALIEALEKQGIKFKYDYTPGSLPLFINTHKDQAGLSGGELLIDTRDSSQFISGILMVAPFANNPMRISLTQTRRQSYIDMTIKMMQDFGVKVTKENNASLYLISNDKRYNPIEYNIEPDASTASYFFALAALSGGEIRVANLDYRNSLQGDVAFLGVLEKMGCIISYIKDGEYEYTQVKGPKVLNGFGLDNPVDVSAFSDTFMTLAAIAPFADKPVYIKGISHTRKQESDRVHAIAVGLQNLGVKVDEKIDDLIIYPSKKEKLHGGIVSSFGDHRIAMSLALVGLMVPGVVIEDAGAVAKTCPDYFELLREASQH